jgi:hypothetical protein
MNSSNHSTIGNDRVTLYGSHEEEVLELSKKLNFSVDDILVAVQEVGFDSDEIEEYLRDRHNRT